MNQSSAPASTAEPPIIAAKDDDAFDRLTFLGWRTGLTAIVAGLAASFFLFGYALIYWRNADMDLMVIYNALVLNDGKPQLFFDHTAYLTILSLKLWFQLLHALGLLDAYSLSAIPPASNTAAFDAAMTSAVRAGRVLAWLIATGCVLIFAALVRLMVRDWRVALMATFAFAFSGGIAVHSRILRSELVAACPVIFALMILIAAGRRASTLRPLWMAVAAALGVLGLENKVQAILLIGVLPVVILPFGGAASASVAFWRVRPTETLASWFAIAAGALLTLLLLNLEYNASNVIAVFNPLEKMLTFTDAATTDAANGSNLPAILLLLLDGVASVLARYSFVLHSSPRPTVFLTWLIVPGIVYAWRRGERQAAIQAVALLAAAIAIDALGVRRGLKSEYFIFTDPLIILAGAVLLDSLCDLWFRKWTYPVAMVLFGLHLAIGQAEPIKYAFMRRGPESICEWNGHYMPLLPLPWCNSPPARP